MENENQLHGSLGEENSKINVFGLDFEIVPAFIYLRSNPDDNE